MRYEQAERVVGFLLLLGLLLFTFFYRLSLEPLYMWDEARRANDSLQLLLRGEWIIDFYDDNPETRSTKSPILLWLQVASMKIFGISLWAIRFPTALCSIFVGLTIWYFTNRYFKSRWLGVLAGFVFASTLGWIYNHAGRSADYDAFLTLFLILYCFCFYAYCIKQDNKWLLWFWLFLTLAVLFKGVAGLFYLPGLAIFALLQKRVKSLLYNSYLYIGLAFFIIVVGSYYIFRELHAPGFLQAVYNNELGGRYLQELEENGQPFLFYIKNLFWRYPYWLYLIAPAFALGLMNRLPKVRTFTLFSAVLISSFVFIISLSETKLYWYDLPIYPLLAIQIALLLYDGWHFIRRQTLKRLHPVYSTAIAVLLFVLLFFAPVQEVYMINKFVSASLEDREQAWFLQEAMKRKRNLNNYTFLYEDYDRHILFYTKLLKLQNNNVRLVNHHRAIRPGSFVVVSEDSTQHKLMKDYLVTKKEEAYGCKVFYVYELKQLARAEKNQNISASFQDYNGQNNP